MARDIGEWLEQLGFGEYAEAFAKNRIKFDHLADLSEHDLRELGVAAMGDRKTLSRAISNCRSRSTIRSSITSRCATRGSIWANRSQARTERRDSAPGGLGCNTVALKYFLMR